MEEVGYNRPFYVMTALWLMHVKCINSLRRIKVLFSESKIVLATTTRPYIRCKLFNIKTYRGVVAHLYVTRLLPCKPGFDSDMRRLLKQIMLMIFLMD